MKRTLLALALAAIAAPLFASDGYKLVARVNGREITNADLDTSVGPRARRSCRRSTRSGGKKAFLENYVAKKLVVQDAVKSGFAAKIGSCRKTSTRRRSRRCSTATSAKCWRRRSSPRKRCGRCMTRSAASSAYPEQAHISIIRALKKESPEAAARNAVEGDGRGLLRPHGARGAGRSRTNCPRRWRRSSPKSPGAFPTIPRRPPAATSDSSRCTRSSRRSRTPRAR